MNTFLKYFYFIQCFAFISIVLTDNQEFCQSFVDNNNNIDYVFEYNHMDRYFLTIGHKSWEIVYFKSKCDLNSKQFYENNWFEVNRSMPFVVWFIVNDDITSLNGFTSKSNHSIHWSPVVVNDSTRSLSLDKDFKQSFPSNELLLEKGFEVKLNFYYQTIQSEVINCFMSENYIQSDSEYQRNYSCIGFSFDLRQTNRTQYVIDELKKVMPTPTGADETILNNIRGIEELISVFIFNSNTMYLFFKKDKTITYCFQYDITFNTECKPNQTLIDCQNYTTTAEMTTTSTTTPELTNEWMKWFWILMSITLSLIAILVIIYCITKRKKKKVITEVLTQSGSTLGSESTISLVSIKPIPSPRKRPPYVKPTKKMPKIE